MEEKDPVEQAAGERDAVDATPEAAPQTETAAAQADDAKARPEAGEEDAESSAEAAKAGESSGEPQPEAATLESETSEANPKDAGEAEERAPETETIEAADDAGSPNAESCPDGETGEGQETSEQLEESPVEAISADQLSLEDKASDEEAERARLCATVEAAVYITEDPLTAKQIAEALEEPADKVAEALADLVTEYEHAHHGLVIREVAEGFKMGTKAEFHDSLRSFVKKLQKPLKLSMASLETLAVVAYKQPITAPEIMEIRGVQGAGVLKTLLDRKLITTAGRKNVIGKPMLYRTTKEFLVQFGLKNIKELPTLKEFEELARVALADAEEPDEAGPEQLELAPGAAAEQPPAKPDADAGPETSEAPDGRAELDAPAEREEQSAHPDRSEETDGTTAPDVERERESEPLQEPDSEDGAEPLGPQSENHSDSETSGTEKRRAAPEE